MSRKRIAYLGLVFILLGVLTFVFGGVGYTSQERQMELGAFETSMEMPGKVRVPLWGSGVLLAGGVALVAVGLRRR